MTDSIAQKLNDLGYIQPEPKKHPTVKIVPARIVGNLVFLSGHGHSEELRGQVDRDITVEQGYQAAREVGVNILWSLKNAIGSLDRVEEIVKVLGFVNCADGFTRQPEVINGFTNLMVELFGEERGTHARSAIGASSLPGNLSVEVEMIVRIKE